jgi:creatinine amidohydrolase
MSWTVFDQRRRETDLVIIPTGAIEVYGPHLPLGTDTIVAEEISRLVAQKVDAIIGPTIEAGDSTSLNIFPGTLTIKPENFKAYLRDICESFIKWGFRYFLFLNTHLGNVSPINQISEDLQQIYGVKCAQIDWWRFVQPQGEGILTYSGYMAHGHASECGTSIMLYLRPELVDTKKIGKTIPKNDYYNIFPDIIKYPRLDFITDSGMIGDATAATAEKGKLIVEKCVNRIIQFINTSFKAD